MANLFAKKLGSFLKLYSIVALVKFIAYANGSFSCFLKYQPQTSSSLTSIYEYLYASDKINSYSYDRTLNTIPLVRVKDFERIKWHLIMMNASLLPSQASLFLIKNAKFGEYLCSWTHHDGPLSSKRLVNAWKLKIPANHKLKFVDNIMSNQDDMMIIEERCLWRLNRLEANKYEIWNQRYNEPLVAKWKEIGNGNMSTKPNHLRGVYTQRFNKLHGLNWLRKQITKSHFIWYIDMIDAEFL